MKLLASRLKELRKQKSISQYKIAKDMGIPQSTYSAYEINRSEPKMEFLVALANYFGVSTDYLLGITDTKYTQTELEFFNELKDKGIDQLIKEYNITLGDEAMSEKDERILIRLIKSFMEDE